jgi:hypothetical protein
VDLVTSPGSTFAPIMAALLFKRIEILFPRLRLVSSARLESTCQSKNARSGVFTKILIEIRSSIWLVSRHSL